MALYIQPTTVFPTASILTTSDIRAMTWAGFSSETTDEEIVSAGYTLVADPAGEQPDSTTLVVDKDQAGAYSASWMANADYQELISTRKVAMAVRAQRNRLLQETDWTQGKDIPNEISSNWTTYRQALRDLTSQTGFPQTINWPQKPV